MWQVVIFTKMTDHGLEAAINSWLKTNRDIVLGEPVIKIARSEDDITALVKYKTVEETR